MTSFNDMSHQQRLSAFNELEKTYEEYCQRKLSLDMSRGKPSAEQLNLSSHMLTCLTEDDYHTSNGIDCRNYGMLDGIPEMKRIFADLLGVDTDEVIIGSNASLSMMFDNIAANMTHGVRDGIPWQRQGQIKFICPVPGYDRHFAICEYFHIEMIPVPMTPEGPDMDVVEKLVSSDPMIKGIWCVPVFSNPDGCVYSDETVRRLASMKPAAHDFRLYWDNAYCIHNFHGDIPVLPNILRECENAGNTNMPYMFASFSKVSFSGGAVAAMVSSKSNCNYIRKRLTVQTIGPDKLNQLRHVRFFGNADGVLNHMKKMADILRPKFELVIGMFEENLSGKDIAVWTNPKGGYFISIDVMNGCAARTVELCKQAGVVITSAGATYPYGNDPYDSNIRIAPSYPTLDELRTAMEIFCITVQLAALEKLLL